MIAGIFEWEREGYLVWMNNHVCGRSLLHSSCLSRRKDNMQVLSISGETIKPENQVCSTKQSIRITPCERHAARSGAISQRLSNAAVVRAFCFSESASHSLLEILLVNAEWMASSTSLIVTPLERDALIGQWPGNMSHTTCIVGICGLVAGWERSKWDTGCQGSVG